MKKFETYNNVFYVVVDKNTGLYLKKSANSAYASDVLTYKLGNARIFSSRAMALIGFNPKQCTEADFEVRKMEAKFI